MEKLFGKTVDVLSTMMEYQSKRHKLIAANIANIDTPGYIPKDIVFKKELDGMMCSEKSVAIHKTNPGHLSSKGCDEYEMVNEGNKVNIDKEMTRLAENNLMYNLSVELLARKFRSLTTVLKEVK
ncbi:MAG: flagellar basal body rod protein FlgB [Deltaproteobacteria bacterium]|nr:flagellar basal body rod protein FlgB [Deltaproteobacteria bacterium]